MDAFAGVAIWEHDVLAIARLRGSSLQKLELCEDCLLPFSEDGAEFEEDYTASYNQFCDEVSTQPVL